MKFLVRRGVKLDNAFTGDESQAPKHGQVWIQELIRYSSNDVRAQNFDWEIITKAYKQRVHQHPQPLRTESALGLIRAKNDNLISCSIV